jgi:predicted  nucleic acid-binding Zn-ribbon protein
MPKNDQKTADVPTLNDALANLQQELQRLKSATEHIEQSKEVARETVKTATKVSSAAAALVQPTRALIGRLEQVDFPGRLDQIIARLGGIQNAVQQLQTQISGAERNLRSDLQAEISSIGQKVTTDIQGLADQIKEFKEASEQRNEDLQREIAVQAEARLFNFPS